MVQMLTDKIDLNYSPDEGGYYLTEYKMDGSGSVRISELRIERNDLLGALLDGTVKWGEWQ